MGGGRRASPQAAKRCPGHGSSGLICMNHFFRRPQRPGANAMREKADLVEFGNCGFVLSHAPEYERPPGTGEAQVAYYRLYFLDPHSGHIAAFEAIEAEDDAQALTLAEHHLGWQPLELWCAGRKVQRFEAAVPARG